MAILDQIMDYVADEMTVKTGSINLANNFTASELQIKQIGKVVMIKGYFTRSAGTGTSEIKIGDIQGVDPPSSLIRFLTGAGSAAYNAWYGAYAFLSSSGGLTVNTNTSRNTINVCLTYIAAD